MARWYRRRRYGGYSRRGKKWSPVTQTMIRQLSNGQQSQRIVGNWINSQDTPNPVFSVGAIMKAKYFRLNVVFTVPVTAFWALVYVPEGMPIGTINVSSPPGADSTLQSLYEPQQFVLASGLYSSMSQSTAAFAGPLRVYSPLARNLNPGDGIYFVWRAVGSAQGEALMTISYMTCVN